MRITLIRLFSTHRNPRLLVCGVLCASRLQLLRQPYCLTVSAPEYSCRAHANLHHVYTWSMHTVPLVFKSWRGPPLLGLPMREAPLTHDRAHRPAAPSTTTWSRRSVPGRHRPTGCAFQRIYSRRSVGAGRTGRQSCRAVVQGCPVRKSRRWRLLAAPSRGIAILSEWSHHDR